jgi:hypothetical protein
MRTVLLALVLLLFGGPLRAQQAAPADSIALGWTTTLDQLQAPAAFVAVCPSEGGAEANIWGTGTYTSDSAICLAALHAGVLTREGDEAFVVEVVDGLPAYTGSTRNGIASLSYPAWPRSFRFPGAPTAATAPAVADYDYDGDWYTTPRQVQAPVGARVRFECSAGGQGGNVWGTDVYTDDSSICEAGVHAGMITRADGGVVHFEMLGPQTSFSGTERHGVSSMRYPGWPGSFRFVPAETAPDAQP